MGIWHEDERLNKLKQARHWALTMGYYSIYRPTEKAALHLWKNNYVNLLHYFGRYGMIYRHLPQRVRRPELEDTEYAARGSYGQRCTNCHRRRPITAHYWKRDKTQKNNFKTICKICDKKKRLKNSTFVGFLDKHS